MAEASNDSLPIDIEASSAQAADGLEKLIQKLERLRPAVSAVADNGSLNKLKNQLNKLSQVAQKLNNLSGFDKITQLVNSLQSLNQLNSINLQAVNKVSRSVDKLREAVNKLNTMPAVDSSKFEQLINAMSMLSGANVQSFSDFLKNLRKLPDIAAKLESMDFGRFADQMRELANAITPVAQQLGAAAQMFNNMPQGLSNYISNAAAAAAASDNTSNSVGGLNTTLANLRLKTVAAISFMRRLVDVLGSAVVKSNQFVENLNLFTVTMSESADEAYKFAEAVNDAMGIDVSDWVRYQGFFQSIGKGFGIASDKADLMSQNLTQLSYDLSSFYNTSVDEAYNKVVSGISGELEPLVLAA